MTVHVNLTLSTRESLLLADVCPEYQPGTGLAVEVADRRGYVRTVKFVSVRRFSAQRHALQIQISAIINGNRIAEIRGVRRETLVRRIMCATCHLYGIVSRLRPLSIERQIGIARVGGSGVVGGAAAVGCCVPAREEIA